MLRTDFAHAAGPAGRSTGGSEPFGEPVLVAPRHGADDDSVLASHATFAWRVATTVLKQRNSGTPLHYRSHRPTAVLPIDCAPGGLRPGDRITRTWDGVSFEVLSSYRAGNQICCDLAEVPTGIH